ncbi:MAG: glycosyltransferase [Ardenticatenaceae bacterium]|nr:glycosyltransferase [Ardenticatenaceae bacterium]
MSFLFLLGVFISFALFILGITAVSNFLFFPRLKTQQPQQQPRLSILIPARNEAAVIAQTVKTLLAQTYANFELILLDDQSEDGTETIAAQAAGDDSRFRLLAGRPLPPGWLGKNWACHQLSQAATGEWLLFADADVRWTAVAVSSLLAEAQKQQADLLAIWPTQQTKSWAERLVVPLLGFVILCYLPILPVHYTRWAAFSAANGQCLLFRRTAYDRIGGHAAVRHNVIEDIALAKQIKRAQLRLRLADANRLVSCRMYQTWAEVRAGFAKNILAGHGNSLLFLLLSTVFHWLVFVLPWLWFALTLDAWPLILLVGGVLLRLGTAVFTRQRPRDAIFMPISVLLMSWIAIQAIWWRYRGTTEWKGRILPMLLVAATCKLLELDCNLFCNVV